MSARFDQTQSGQNSFPRTARLLKPADFQKVFRDSRASTDRYFKILCRMNGSQSSRLGLAVSKKVDKRAVGRNRIKRVLRQSFRTSFDTVGMETDSTSGVDLVILPRNICATICNKQLFQSLESHWSRIQNIVENDMRLRGEEATQTRDESNSQRAGRE